MLNVVPAYQFGSLNETLEYLKGLRLSAADSVTKDNLRHDNKTLPTTMLASSTTCICTNITTADDKMGPNPRESGLRILTNKRSDFKQRDMQNYFHTILFHSVPSPAL